MCMRTTLDIDDNLLALAQAKFPAGTPKTVIFEEALRRLIGLPDPAARTGERRDPRLDRLVAEGKVTLATVLDVPPPPGGGVPLAQLLADLNDDRADR